MSWNKTYMNQSILTTVITTKMGKIQHVSAVCDANQAQSVENILYVILLGTILFCSVVGNIFVVTAGLMSRQLRSRVTIYLIISLAFSDLILSLFSIPFKISSKLYSHKFCYDISACYVLIISDAVGNIASILNLFIIAIDRFIAIKFPFRYPYLLSKVRAKYIIICIWLFSLTWGFIAIFRWRDNNAKNSIFSIAIKYTCTNENYFFYAISFIIYLFAFCIITCTYCTILSVALNQIKEIEKNEKVTSRFIQQQDYPEISLKKKRKSVRRELKATKSVAIVYLAFVVCWMPSAVINIILLFNKSYFVPMQATNKKQFLLIYYLCVEVLPSLNTMVNPLIYSFANKQFRIAFTKLAYKLIGKTFNGNEYLSENISM